MSSIFPTLLPHGLVQTYLKYPEKNWGTLFHNCPWFYNAEICSENVDKMTDSEDLDQTAPNSDWDLHLSDLLHLFRIYTIDF